MNRAFPRCALGLLCALPLSAQVSITDFFVFKGTVYEQTSSSSPTVLANPAPHAPGPYYIDVGVNGTDLGSAPSFKKPGSATSTSLTADPTSTRWDFKDGYSTQALLDLAYPNGDYGITIPGFNGGSEITLRLGDALANDQYPAVVPQVASLGPGLSWSNGKLIVDVNTATTLNINAFTDYNTTHSGGLEFRQRLAIVPPSGSDFGLLAVSAFNDPSFTSYAFSSNPLTVGTEYRVVLEYDVFTTRMEIANPPPNELTNAEGGAIFSHQTQFFMVAAIPEPSTYALIAGLAMLAGAAWRKHVKQSAPRA